jgi:hypothetical protein
MTQGTYRTIDVSDVIAKLGDPSHGLRAARVVQTPTGGVPDMIFQAASGPTTFSTCTALASLEDQPIFDVNRYYRDLGIAWPYRPTRRDLQRAYNRCGGESAPNADRLAYCLSQLLDRETRLHYDTMPLGQPMGDQYTWNWVQLQAAQWASERNTALAGQDAELATAQDYLAMIGMADRLDQDDEDDVPESVQSFVSSVWPYGYYLLRSRRYDDSVLSEWQQLIIAACSKIGLRRQLALGYVGQTSESWTISSHNSELVIFLNENQAPSEPVADEISACLSHSDYDHPERYYSVTTATPDTTDDFEFRTGGKQAEERQEAEQAARKAARGKTDWITSLLKEPGTSCIIRFVVDEPNWIEVMQHTFVPTKAAPADKPAESNWPERTGAVCRKTERANGQPFHEDCYICDRMRQKNNKPYSRGLRMWAIGVVRKEVLGTEDMVKNGQIEPYQVGQRVGLVDDVVEVEEVKDGKVTGNKIKKKHYVIINMALKNFFSEFVQYAKYYGTALDRDYIIERKGEGTDSVYRSTPLDVIQVPLKDEQGNVIGMEPFDLRNPKYAERYNDHGIKLGELVKHRMSDDYYARYFDPTKTVPWSTTKSDDDADDAAASGSSSATSASSEPKADTTTDVATQERLAAMRARITDNNPVRSGNAPTLMNFS